MSERINEHNILNIHVRENYKDALNKTFLFVKRSLNTKNKLSTSTNIWRETKQSNTYIKHKNRNLTKNKKIQKLKMSAHNELKTMELKA